jgi:hypothetical protein
MMAFLYIDLVEGRKERDTFVDNGTTGGRRSICDEHERISNRINSSHGKDNIQKLHVFVQFVIVSVCEVLEDGKRVRVCASASTVGC